MSRQDSSAVAWIGMLTTKSRLCRWTAATNGKPRRGLGLWSITWVQLGSWQWDEACWSMLKHEANWDSPLPQDLQAIEAVLRKTVLHCLAVLHPGSMNPTEPDWKHPAASVHRNSPEPWLEARAPNHSCTDGRSQLWGNDCCFFMLKAFTHQHHQLCTKPSHHETSKGPKLFWNEWLPVAWEMQNKSPRSGISGEHRYW